MIFLLFVFYIYNNESLVTNIFSKIKVNLVLIVLVNTDLFRLVKLKALPYRFITKMWVGMPYLVKEMYNFYFKI